MNSLQVEMLNNFIAHLKAKNYSPRTITSYSNQLRFLFEHYQEIPPKEITPELITNYIVYLREVHQCGLVKIRHLAFGVKYLYKNFFGKDYLLPVDYYPRREYKLPEVMSPEEVARLLNVTDNIKSRAILEVYYSTGIRRDELRNLKLNDINSAEMYIRVNQGKGRRDRLVLLSQRVLELLRKYFVKERPVEWLFNGKEKGSRIALGSLNWIMRNAVKKAGLKKSFTLHTLRHSFATHMLDQGNDIHTIKELLGHSKIETTMVYLHLQTKKRAALVSPIEVLMCPEFNEKRKK